MKARGRGLAAVAPSSEEGATAVEYALLVALVAAVVVGAVVTLAGVVAGLFSVPW